MNTDEPAASEWTDDAAGEGYDRETKILDLQAREDAET